MEERQVRTEVTGAQARLTIDRESARNALSAQVLAEITEGLKQAEANPAVRVIVLTGAGDRVFCAGGDLSSMTGDGFAAAHESRRAYGALLQRIQNCTRPVIARVNGHALAGGLGLVLACDLAIATDVAGFGTPEIDRGLFPFQVTALLQRHVGRKRALRLLLSGERLSAKEAAEWGLISHVVAPADLEKTVDEVAQSLANKSRAVLELGRRAFFASEDLPLPPAIELLASQLSINICLEDAAEGVTSFLQKRPPKWNDK